MVAEKVEQLKQGRPEKDANLHDKTSRAQAAKMLNVSTRSVASASKVRSKGTPELAQAVEQGNLAVSVAAKVAIAAPSRRRLFHPSKSAWRAGHGHRTGRGSVGR
jgi:hypothetical protein